MVNVFRLCSIINSLYSQVAGDLETCSWLWQNMSPKRLGATWFATAVNKFPSPLPPDRTTNKVIPYTTLNYVINDGYCLFTVELYHNRNITIIWGVQKPEIL